MQDNGTEKTADIMQMDEVYSNSRLNISAAEGQILKGLIFNRKLLEFNPCRATVRVRESQEDVNLYAFPDRFFLRPTEAPLNKRGWVFQERTLAPRIIHFTKNQVFWECHSLEASEVLPQGDSLELGHVGKGVGISSALSKQELQSRWYAFVSHYSGTSVTYSEDRLLALSAVAKQFCLAMRLDPSKYLAGVWEDELPLSMLWHQVPDPDMRGPELIASIAPSWSWASIGGQISYIELSRQISNVELLGVQATRISPNPFGGTSSCRLRLRGAVCKCRRYVRSGVPWVCITQRTKFQESANAPGDNQVGIYWDKSRKAVADWLNTIGSSSSSSTCFLLHIASQKEDQLGPIQRGVILQRTAIRGTYTRIGSFFIFRDSYSNSDLENAFNGHLNTLDTDDYLELNSIGKYTINIV
ncbi:heterokaryon incompatibility [Trichoderma arundinaceum]|uniref:Heterokaryon incompatibility n=1 Tax=Trichoderma arundinaceum TaxID=490622 RepID=A0A395P467_TRIAR|nr:heterokaryon incompatibility [Trichoderma arundinaceum]